MPTPSTAADNACAAITTIGWEIFLQPPVVAAIIGLIGLLLINFLVVRRNNIQTLKKTEELHNKKLDVEKEQHDKKIAIEEQKLADAKAQFDLAQEAAEKQFQSIQRQNEEQTQRQNRILEVLDIRKRQIVQKIEALEKMLQLAKDVRRAAISLSSVSKQPNAQIINTVAHSLSKVGGFFEHADNLDGHLFSESSKQHVVQLSGAFAELFLYMRHKVHEADQQEYSKALAERASNVDACYNALNIQFAAEISDLSTHGLVGTPSDVNEVAEPPAGAG